MLLEQLLCGDCKMNITDFEQITYKMHRLMSTVLGNHVIFLIRGPTSHVREIPAVFAALGNRQHKAPAFI
jgi:hypothetical protein